MYDWQARVSGAFTSKIALFFGLIIEAVIDNLEDYFRSLLYVIMRKLKFVWLTVVILQVDGDYSKNKVRDVFSILYITT